MSWAKFDDRYHDSRKVKRAWRAHPRAVGLHAMAITYCAMHETDGLVDPEWIVDKLPVKREREQTLAALVDAGLFHVADDGCYLVNDYLEYNDSAATLQERRRRDAERKARGGRNGRPPESSRTPNGFHTDSERNPDGVQAESESPDPTRPIEEPPTPSPGESADFEEWLLDHQAVTGHDPPRRGTKAFTGVRDAYMARRREGYPQVDLLAATRGAQADDYRREHGYTTADSVLRPTKIAALIARGRRHSKPKADIVALTNRRGAA